MSTNVNEKMLYETTYVSGKVFPMPRSVKSFGIQLERRQRIRRISYIWESKLSTLRRRMKKEQEAKSNDKLKVK